MNFGWKPFYYITMIKIWKGQASGDGLFLLMIAKLGRHKCWKLIHGWGLESSEGPFNYLSGSWCWLQLGLIWSHWSQLPHIVFPCGCLSFCRAWWLGSKSKHCKRESRRTALLLQTSSEVTWCGFCYSHKLAQIQG